MSDNICGNCGAPFAEGDTSCPECGMPMASREQIEQPRTERYCSSCGGVVRVSDRFCEQCGVELAKLDGDDVRVQAPVDVPVKLQGAPVKEKVVLAPQAPSPSRDRVPVFAQPLVHTRKRLGRNSSMPPATIALIALLVLAGLGLGAYKFLSKEKPPVLAQSDTMDVLIDDEIPEIPPPPVLDDLTVLDTPASPDTPVAQPVTPDTMEPLTRIDTGPIRYVWSLDDPRGYSRLEPSDPSRAPSANPALQGSVTGDRVRLRSEPNTTSSVLNHYSKGAKVEVIQRYTSGSEKFPWYNIRAGERVGWMYGEYVKITEN
jgi:RNA polymerase subunit RPABC4/transcription elongation factor Spt4